MQEQILPKPQNFVKQAIFALQKLPRKLRKNSRDSPQGSTGYTASCLNAGRLHAIAVAVYRPYAISLIAGNFCPAKIAPEIARGIA
jgi:hypothetical protein